MTSITMIRAFSLLFLLSSPVLSQTPTPTPQKEDERQAQKELERKALGMLDEVIKDSESYKQLENRVRIRATAAYILWKHDEPRARALFTEAIAGLNDILKNTDEADPRRMFGGPRQLRAEMLQMLSQRDARLARQLLRISPPAKSTENESKYDIDREMDLNLAQEIASNDPKLAADIARESMSKGLSYQLPSIIAAMRAKDPETAARLASDLIARLRTEKLDSNGEARNVAFALLRAVIESPEQDGGADGKIVTPLLDQTTMSELTEMVATEALRSPSQNAGMLSALQRMMPVVEKYAPGLAVQVRAKAPKSDEEDEEIETPVHEWGKYADIFRKGSADELLAAAQNAPLQIRDSLYQAAASKLLISGDTARARQIIADKIRDPSQREQMMREVDKASAVAAVEQGKTEESRKLLLALKTPEDRAVLLTELAATSLAKGDKKTALQFLDEARELVARRARNVNQLTAQLRVVHGYVQIDPSKSLAMLDPIIDQLNELLAAATVLGGFFVDELVQDDEIMLGPVGNLLSAGLMQQYVGAIATIARADFDRTKALADKFQRDEIRTLMRLILAQSILAPLPKEATELKLGATALGP
ncbi:MAG: hypothetical protein QOJ64_994 [Acidobacteriota bacterium]|jgi:hypothetical protein|nr:hypothetical protein [Acidobacteriota bacterium]